MRMRWLMEITNSMRRRSLEQALGDGEGTGGALTWLQSMGSVKSQT